ncbi:hypothetical protein LXL04_035363 [Taraxacum kok-saghyz]
MLRLNYKCNAGDPDSQSKIRDPGIPFRILTHNNSHLEAHPIFEDPTSLKQVKCPYIYDPAEKYILLIIHADNEELRLPAALDETMNFVFKISCTTIFNSVKGKTAHFHMRKMRSHKKKFMYKLMKAYCFCESIAKQGMLHWRGKLLLMLDADGATKADDMEKLEKQVDSVAKMKPEEGIEDIPVVAFGSCAHLEKKALAIRKWYGNFLMKGFHVVVLLAAGPRVHDTQVGCKVVGMHLAGRGLMDAAGRSSEWEKKSLTVLASGIVHLGGIGNCNET